MVRPMCAFSVRKSFISTRCGSQKRTHFCVAQLFDSPAHSTRVRICRRNCHFSVTCSTVLQSSLLQAGRELLCDLHGVFSSDDDV